MTIEIKRNTLWKQSGNIWHCRKTTISQFFSSSLWLWWDLEAWLGMAWQALALKVALATLMECMWHTRCLGDWTVVKCDEKPLRNHMVQFLQAEGYQQALETCEFWLLFWDWFLHIYIYSVSKEGHLLVFRRFCWLPQNSRSKVLRHVGSFAAFQTKQTGRGHFSAFLKLRSSRSASAFYIFLLIKTTMICEYMIHIIHMIHMHSSGYIAELHHARQRPSIPSHQLLKAPCQGVGMQWCIWDLQHASRCWGLKEMDI